MFTVISISIDTNAVHISNHNRMLIIMKGSTIAHNSKNKKENVSINKSHSHLQNKSENAIYPSGQVNLKVLFDRKSMKYAITFEINFFIFPTNIMNYHYPYGLFYYYNGQFFFGFEPKNIRLLKS